MDASISRETERLTEIQSKSDKEKHRMRGLKRTNPWTEAEIAMLKAAYSPNVPASELGLQQLADRLGRLKSNVCRKARELGLTNQKRLSFPAEQRRASDPLFSDPEERRKHISQTRKEWIAVNGHPRGSAGMKHTPEVKQIISEQSKARWAAMTEEERGDLILKRIKTKREKGSIIPNPRGKWKAGWREIGGQRCYFRSRWEANYARYLEWLKSKGQISYWEHEPKTFWFDGIKRGVVSYLPDFRVTNVSGEVEWHEVKGWMDSRSKTAIARMGRYHPNERLLVIREKEYNEIKRKLSSLIAEWEEA